LGALDLSTLPDPQIIEELDFEIIVSRQKAEFATVWTEVRANNPEASLPAYDVAMLETDPPALINEAESYRETLLRQRVNEAIQAYMLPFSEGSDLQMLAAFYDVSKLAGETDERLRGRVILAIQGRSPGGTAARYKSVAMSADIGVADAVIYTVGRSPVVHVAIFSTAPDGVASALLLDTVNAALQASDVRMVNDTIIVSAAVRRVVSIEADVWLLPDADDATLVRAEATLREAWATTQSLGRDFVQSWWVSKLMADGVHRIAPKSPADTAAAPYEAIAIGTVILNLKGRDF
jgi:phage-related baseplate assembly protein